MRRALLASVLLAIVVSAWTVFEIGLAPPSLEPRALEMGAASTRVLVDSPRSLVVDLTVETGDIEAITNRALLVGNVMVSAPVRRYIARRARVPLDELKVASPITQQWPRPLAQSGEQKHARDILNSPAEYRLNIKANPTVPVIDIFAQGPSAQAAEALANGAVTGMRDYLRDVAAAQGVEARHRVTLEQLGRAQGGVVNEGPGATVAALSFTVVLLACCASLLFFARVRRGWLQEAPARRATSQPRPPGPARA